MGKTSSWKNSTIQVLRVPVVFGTILKRIARNLDNLEADQEFIFVYKLTNPEALQTDKFHKAAEMSFRVINKNEEPVALAAIDPSASECWLPIEEEEDDDTSDDCKCNSHYEIDLNTLISDLEAIEETDEAQPDEAQLDEEPDQTLNIDAWQAAIGSVELATTHHTAAVRPEELGLLDLYEFSTLFAVPTATEAETEATDSFDPDAVIEAVLAHQEPTLDNFEPTLDNFDPDVVIEAIEASAAVETAVETRVETNEGRPSEQPTVVEESDMIGLDLPQIQIPKLPPLNQSLFAAQLFATWQRLAAQKLLEQQRPEAEPWGVTVALNAIYQAQFAALSGDHFLQGVQGVALNPADGKKIQLIATPGIVNHKIAGVDANAITYVSDHSGQPQGKQQQQPGRIHVTSPQPEVTPPQAFLAPTPVTLDSERERLLKERQRRIDTAKQQQQQSQAKPQSWFKRFLETWL